MQPQKIFAIIVAAGMGKRLRKDLPKALVSVHGTTLLERTLIRVREAVRCEQTYITYPDGFIGEYEKIIENFDGSTLVLGGSTRQLSVRAAIETLKELNPNTNDLVLVHDAARCLVSPDAVRRVVEEARMSGAATLGIPQADSLKRVSKETSYAEETIEREGLWRIQTPQVFEFQHLSRAHDLAGIEATDDASLVQHIAQVKLVPGEDQNFKVTTPWELKLLELLDSQI